MNYIYLLLCSYGNPQKIIRMMLELKNCKKAVMERTSEVLGQTQTRLLCTLCISSFVCSEYRFGHSVLRLSRMPGQKDLLLLSDSGSRSVRTCTSQKPCCLRTVIDVSTRDIHSSICANSTPKLAVENQSFPLYFLLFFSFSVRFQLQEIEGTLDIFRRKKLIQGIRCFQKSWRGRL